MSKEVRLHMKNSKLRLHDYIFISAGILLFLTLLSFWLVCGLFAKYTAKDTLGSGARAAVFGAVAVKEHEAVLKSADDAEDIKDVYYNEDYFYDMVYCLTENEVSSNLYDIMMPGVDIPKDPFVRVTPSEVDCTLYIEVRTDKFPEPYTDKYGAKHEDLVTYKIAPDWKPIKSGKGPNGGDVYQYRNVIEAGASFQEIKLLEDDKVSVSQYYDADKYSESSLLVFNAWLVQAD